MTSRVQLQQVLLNLIINAVEALSGVSEGARELLISTGKVDSGAVLVAVQDSGPGLEPAMLAQVAPIVSPWVLRKHERRGRVLSLLIPHRLFIPVECIPRANRGLPPSR